MSGQFSYSGVLENQQTQFYVVNSDSLSQDYAHRYDSGLLNESLLIIIGQGAAKL